MALNAREPPQEHERLRWLAVYANRNARTALAPVVERLADLRDGGAYAVPHVVRPAPPGWVPLRPVAAKVLAFDEAVRDSAMGVCLAAFFGWAAASTAYISPDRVHAKVWVVGLIAVGVASLGVAAWAFMVAGRLCVLRRILSRSVVVPARVISSERYIPNRGLAKKFTLTFQYQYAGGTYKASGIFDQPACWGMGWAPELLVDTNTPQFVIVRDLYT